jgi:hypothetical protein
MAGLNDILASKDISTTAMPSWYSTATQNVGTGASGVTPTAPGSTALPSAAGAFNPTGQFQSGTNVLQSIGQGAVNPWLTSTDPTTGATSVKPNTNTAMGGLFSAQQDYLNQILPDINASATAPAIGAGGFGSKMNLAGITKARGQAASDLFQKQMQSALQNQQTGVSAGAGLGNIGNQLVQSGLNTATYQQNLPYADYMNQAKILQALSPDKTTVEQKQLSPVSQIGALASALGGSGPVSNLLSSLGVSGGISGLGSVLSNLGSGGGSGSGGGGSRPSIWDYGYNPINPDNYEPIDLDGGEFGNPGLPDWFWTESYD